MIKVQGMLWVAEIIYTNTEASVIVNMYNLVMVVSVQSIESLSHSTF